MIPKKEFIKEHIPKKVRNDIESKRLSDIQASSKQGVKLKRKLVGKSIFPNNRKKYRI